MKLSAALFAFFALPTFVTSIPLLDSVNDGYVSVTAKRLNERNLDKRQLSSAMFDIVTAINVYADEYNSYRGYSRDEFTQDVIQALYNYNPHFNYIICHVDHDYDFPGPVGVNVYNYWVTYQKSIPGLTRPPGFDVVIGTNGTFVRWGDGGYINWAYIGNVIDTQDVFDDQKGQGFAVTFDIPS
ncbi:hypothetical protein M378DRAFT_652352 [Amanita muscaria Koide BX008]|uniref:Uncharacterized protein n=1 Tax=Amanita muscaria (strain Koide BX008) TaxID=946122 RepID=A0A0C2X380_AMAMK|nr:hypothetical protein M378DRAFT_652352 [Amanita muscaria Koide BX008]